MPYIQSYFYRDERDRPIVHANVWHEAIDRQKARKSFRFVVDTGADHTFIIPEHQDYLDIPKKAIEKYPEKIYTFEGEKQFYCIRPCDLYLSGRVNTITIEDLTILLLNPNPKKAKEIPMRGEGIYPSVLGRDALAKLAMIYCQDLNHLYLTDEMDVYQRFVEEIFPPMPEPDDFDGFDLLEHAQ